MSNTKISVTEADIDDELIQQHQATSNPKTLTIKLPKVPRPRLRKPHFKLSGVIVVIIFLVLASGAGLGYKKYTALMAENRRLANPQAAAEDETMRLKNEVGQLIELPNEKPTIATVVDVEKLKGQPFFANAQKGDRVLLFAEAKKAILYREGSKKIIEIAPINIGASGVAGQSTSQPNSTPTTTTSPTNTTKRQ